MYVVLSCLPWVGKELYEKKDVEMDRLLSQVEGYLKYDAFRLLLLHVLSLSFPLRFHFNFAHQMFYFLLMTQSVS